MDLTDIKPTIIDSEESLNILPKPRSFTFDNPAMVRRLLYEYNWFYYMNLSCILPEPRSFTFDNPAMVRRLLYEYNWFYDMNLFCIFYAVINLWSSGYPLRLSLFSLMYRRISQLFTFNK